MKRFVNWCLALVLLSATGVAGAANQGYTVLDKPQRTEVSDGVEVREFFSYGCPHCFTFRPLFHSWLEKAPEGVKVVRVPVIFNKAWEPLAKAYYVAEALGAVDKLHKPLFEAVNVQKKKLRKDADLVEFFTAHGFTKEQVNNALNSFTVDMKMRQNPTLLKAYGITSTPTVVVNGKYVVTPTAAGGQERMIQIIDGLVKQELAARKPR